MRNYFANADIAQYPREAREEPHRLNLSVAADIMREQLFAPLGLSLPFIPVRWAGFNPFDPEEEARTLYNGVPKRPRKVEVLDNRINRDPVHAAGTLAHELAHVIAQPVYDPAERLQNNGHPAHWAKIARAIGLDFQSPWYTIPGPKFVEFYNRHLAGIADA